MMNQAQELEREKKNKRIAMISSIGFHVVLLLIFLFAIAWRAPDPPLPEYGIELNFGLDRQGSGDVQPEKPVGSDQQTEDQKQEIKNDQPQEEEQPTSSESKPQESKAVDQPVTTKQESPVTVKEQKKEEPKVVEKPKEKVTEKAVETKEPVKQPDPKAVYNPNTSKSTAENTQTKTGEAGNQGDDANKTGDKGDPKGSLDAKALYGKQGGGDGGAKVELSGFEWGKINKPEVPDEAFGEYKFQIKVDRNGDIVSIIPLTRGLSIKAEQIFKKEIEGIVFIPTGNNLPEFSTGTITFVVRSK